MTIDTTVPTGAAERSDQPPLVVDLPTPAGMRPYQLTGKRSPAPARNGEPPRSRTVFAAAHVTCDPLTTAPDGHVDQVDWATTLCFREHVWGLGLGVADAMDTAQRGGGLSWAQASELIKRSGHRARELGASVVFGAATDQLIGTTGHALGLITEAYIEQVELINASGGVPVLMASRALAATASDADDYRTVYDAVLAATAGPVYLHWLGEAFDPQLAGYWGNSDLDAATETVLQLLRDHADRFAGIKVSLLDADREIRLRRALPAGVQMFTGDDFHYDELIAGDDEGHSNALLGAFAAIPDIARAALGDLDAGDRAGYFAKLSPTIPLARHLFAAPTSAYKTGVVFLAWLNGRQDHPLMLGGAQSLRSIQHLAELFRLADTAGALTDPGMAVELMQRFLAVTGAGQVR